MNDVAITSIPPPVLESVEMNPPLQLSLTPGRRSYSTRDRDCIVAKRLKDAFDAPGSFDIEFQVIFDRGTPIIKIRWVTYGIFEDSCEIHGEEDMIFQIENTSIGIVAIRAHMKHSVTLEFSKR